VSAKKAKKSKGGGDSNSTLYIGLAVAVVVVAGGAWYLMGGESEPDGNTPSTAVNMPAPNPDPGQPANAGRAPLERQPLERTPIERSNRPERKPRVASGADGGTPPPRTPAPVVRKPRGKPTGKKFMD
jgi:hypothetical protein